jgi:hypothetical protein
VAYLSLTVTGDGAPQTRGVTTKTGGSPTAVAPTVA